MQRKTWKSKGLKATTFEVFTNCEASSLDGMRRKTNYLHNL
jgi:hypothetical protein